MLILQIFQKSDSTDAVRSVICTEQKFSAVKINRTAVCLPFSVIFYRNFNPFISVSPYISDRIAPQQMTFIFRKNI